MASEQTKRGSKSAKAGLVFPVSRFQRHLRKGHYAERIGTAGAVYMAGVLEYLTAEILELSGNAARANKRMRIVPRHINLAIKNDAELDVLFRGVHFPDCGVLPNINPMLLSVKTKQKNKSSKPTDDIEDETEDEIEDDTSSQNY